MQSFDTVVQQERFDHRLETDLYFADLVARLGRKPLEMDRNGLGVWLVLPVNIDDLGHVLLTVPKDDQHLLGTSVFFQSSRGLTNGLIAGILLRLLDQVTARFMTTEGEPIKPLFPSGEPTVDQSDGIQI